MQKGLAISKVWGVIESQSKTSTVRGPFNDISRLCFSAGICASCTVDPKIDLLLLDDLDQAGNVGKGSPVFFALGPKTVESTDCFGESHVDRDSSWLVVCSDDLVARLMESSRQPQALRSIDSTEKHSSGREPRRGLEMSSEGFGRVHPNAEDIEGYKEGRNRKAASGAEYKEEVLHPLR